jgi:hypothetical protein
MSEEKEDSKVMEPCRIRIFPNYHKKGGQPDYKGVLTDEMGDEFVISCWKTPMKGGFYLGGRIIRKTDLKDMFEQVEEEEKKAEESKGSDFDLFN